MLVEAPIKGTRKAESPMNQWIHSELSAVANKLGLDRVPMADPDFDFFGLLS